MIRALLYVILVLSILIGSCTQYLWWDYQQHQPRPCGGVGRQRRYTSIEEYAPAGNGYGAMCGGYTTSGRWVSYQTRGR